MQQSKPASPRRNRWIGAWLAGIALWWPAWGWAQSPTPPAVPAWQAQWEAQVAPAWPTPWGVDEQYEFSRQGTAELLWLQQQILDAGEVSPRGAIVECAALGRRLRTWIETTQTLSGVYLGASWLEQWGLQCRPRQSTVWTRSDERRLVDAIARVRQTWPAQWEGLHAAYAPDQVRPYVQAISRQGSLAVADRACAQQALRQWRAGTLAWEQASHVMQEQCTPSATRPPVESRLWWDKYPDSPLANALASPFLSLDRWGLSPDALVGVLRQEEANQAWFAEMAELVSLPSALQDRRQILSEFARANLTDTQQKQAFAAQRSQWAEPLAQALDAVRGRWPSPEQCAQAGQAVRTWLAQTQDGDALLALIGDWMHASWVCPGQEWSNADQDLIARALVASQDQVGPWTVPEALQAKLARHSAQQIVRDLTEQMPAPRLACVHAVLPRAQQSGLGVEQALRTARAQCPSPWLARQPASEHAP